MGNNKFLENPSKRKKFGIWVIKIAQFSNRKKGWQEFRKTTRNGKFSEKQRCFKREKVKKKIVF